METYFQGFHEDEQFSTNLLLSNVDDLMKDQLEVLDNIKIEENDSWIKDECENRGKEDFHQIMSDWYQHIGPLQSIDNEDINLGMDANLDTLNNYSNNDLFEEIESPIFSKALKYPEKKKIVNIHPISKLAPQVSKDSFLESLIGCPEPQTNQKQGFVKTEPNFIRKFTLVNGEKEILGKNIIGLHCLNEIQESPDENCQITSTVINGKRYKIIIKPKSLKVKKLSEEKIRKTLIKKLMQRNIVTKAEAKEDEIISEMCNGNYDVPILNGDLLPSWDFSALDSDWSNEGNNDSGNASQSTDAEPVKKVPPIRIKVPKSKKHKKRTLKSDEEIDVEGVNDEVIQANNLTSLLKNFEEEVAKLERNEQEQTVDAEKSSNDAKHIRSSLPKEMIDRIEALKRKKDRRISLIQAMPTKKAAKSSTRMQDAVATMNRNKLIKIVSGGDAVQMDHDYCSIFVKSSDSKQQQQQQLKKNPYTNANLAEKNPKKDSGMESGDVSDASEGPNTPESVQSSQFLRMKNTKKSKESAAEKTGRSAVAKPSTTATSPSDANAVSLTGSDSVKTKTVSNGNKDLTNGSVKSVCNSENSNSVPNISPITESSSQTNVAENEKTRDAGASQPIQNERPKKKLKLEEYLNRKLEKERKAAVGNAEEMVDSNELMKSVEISEGEKIPVKKSVTESGLEKTEEVKSEGAWEKKEMEKNWRHRSSSASSGERSRKKRRSSRSHSRSYWRRSSSNSSSSRQKRRNRVSEGRGRRKRSRFWSGSSRSSSKESSSSSDRSRGKYYKFSRCRRSNSRSISRDRSRSRNRGYSKRRYSGIYYHNRKFNNARSRSPFYSTREKQRQIEERRVIYVGRIEEGMTNAKLRERFSIFGPIVDISLHFREYGDNYGFVTYAYKADAYDAIEHGNDNPTLPHYDLCFGGRRGFCKEKYADLDGMPTSYSGFNDAPITHNAKNSFDLLLKEAQAKLKDRKKQ